MTDPTLVALEFGLTKEAELLLLIGALVAILLMGAAVISWLNRWRKKQLEAEDDLTESVGSFRQMYESGELSKEEYERILQKTAENAKKKWGTPSRPSPKVSSSQSGVTQDLSKLGTIEMPKPPSEGDPTGSG